MRTLINVLYFNVRVSSSGSMRSGTTVRAVGGALLTSIHEYRISCKKPAARIRTMPSDRWLPLEEIRYARGSRGKGVMAARAGGLLLGFECWQNRCFFFANFS